MSPDADPDNPDGKYWYHVRVMRDWHDDAVEAAQKLPEWSGENYSSARKFIAERIER